MQMLVSFGLIEKIVINYKGDDMKSIAIIGAGQLGSRHLQALSMIKDTANLYIVDPNEKSLVISKERFNEIKHADKNLYICKKVTELPKNLDFAVVATNSKQRLQVVIELINHTKVKNLLLEKFLFPYEEEYETAQKKLRNINTFVNCGRSMLDSYRNLKNNYVFKKLSMTVSGGSWNMASNAIHMINLFTYLTDTSVASVDMSKLDSRLKENKRAGYIEVTGEISCHDNNGNSLILKCNQTNEPVVIKLATPTTNFTIREADNKIEINDTIKDFPIEYQSKLTNKIFEQLESTGSCDLVKFEQSVAEHLIFLKALNRFLNGREGIIT